MLAKIIGVCGSKCFSVMMVCLSESNNSLANGTGLWENQAFTIKRIIYSSVYEFLTTKQIIMFPVFNF
jgi:hypothetical protein